MSNTRGTSTSSCLTQFLHFPFVFHLFIDGAGVFPGTNAGVRRIDQYFQHLLHAAGLKNPGSHFAHYEKGSAAGYQVLT